MYGVRSWKCNHLRNVNCGSPKVGLKRRFNLQKATTCVKLQRKTLFWLPNFPSQALRTSDLRVFKLRLAWSLPITPPLTREPPIADVMARTRACVQLHFKNFWTKPGKWDHLKNRTTYSQSLRWSYFPGLTVLKLNCHVRGSRHVTLRKGMFLKDHIISS